MSNLYLNKVNSSNIEQIAHKDNSLYVWYKSGNLYEYLDVPVETYTKLLESESKGRFMNSEVKGKFKYKKLEIPAI